MNIEKLKQKILDLAIRGKLIPQDPNDEPASVLIEKIKAEKERLVKEGKIKASKEESYIFKGSDNCYYEKKGNNIKNIDDEIPFEIPDNWAWVRLNFISLDIKAGGDCPDVVSKTKTEECSIPIYSNGIENNGLYGYTDKPKILDKSVTISARGTIGFCCVRQEPYVPIVRLLSVIPSSYVLLDYLSIFINSSIETGSGTSTLQLTIPNIKPKLIAIPPLNEQMRIVNFIKDIQEILIKIQTNYNKINKATKIIKTKILEDLFGENSSYKSYYGNEYTLGELLPYEQPGPYIVKSPEYDDSFITPVITPGKSFILGYTNETDGIYHVNNNKVIIFDDFTTASRLIDFDFKVKSSAMKILKSVDNDKFNIDYLYYLLQTIYVNNDTHKRYWISEYAPLKLKIHKYEEQLKIVNRIKQTYKILDSINKL